MTLHKLLDDVKKMLRPSDEIMHARNQVVEDINNELKKREIDAVAVGGGSVAKNTFLVNAHDVDIFVRFSLNYDENETSLPDLVEDCLKKYKPERIHGSRDYFQFEFEGYDFEIVPVLAVSDHSEAQNVTDMSPLHVEYFVGKNSDHEDDIRLAKQFCKSANVYGAESYISGFSGHVVDILILHYGNFYDFVKSASKWKAPVVVDIEGHHKDPISSIDTAKHSPLVLIDPVQPNRNAAAALSEEKFNSFVSRCKEFLKDPSYDFFIVPEFVRANLDKELKSHAGAAVVVSASHNEDDKKDVAGAKVRKAFERIKARFEKEGFTLVEDGWNFEFDKESLFWFVTEEHSLPRMAQHRGPPVSNESDAARFRETHSEVTEEDGVLYAKIERNITKPEQVPDSLRDEIRENLSVNLGSVKLVEDA